MRTRTVVVPHPETVTINPAGGSNSEVGGGKVIDLAEATVRSRGSASWKYYGTRPLVLTIDDD